MPPLSPEEISRLDLRRTAYHEHAHAVVARYLGYVVTVEVWRAEDVEDPYGDLMLWRGRCRIYTPPEGEDDRRMIGLAGDLAVGLLSDPDLNETEALDRLFPETRSATDVRSSGEFTLDEVEDCLTLLRSLWPTIETAVEWEVAKQELLKEARNRLDSETETGSGARLGEE